MAIDLPPAALRLRIDKEALAANWQALDDLSGSASAAAAVKADAYGIGVPQVVPALQQAGCRNFLVAHWSEVPDLLGLIEPDSISVLHGPMNSAEAEFAQATGVKPVINSIGQARIWLDAGGGRCDLMVDTGMNRLGLPMSDLGSEWLQSLDIDVLMSHLASADEDTEFNDTQRRRWNDACIAIPHLRSSLANSAGIVLGREFHGELTRPGLSLYGGIPRSELSTRIRQVAYPQAAIMQVRTIDAGDGVGYNSTFVASSQMRIGTIAIGYADGYLRCWSGKGTLSCAGKALRVLGRVSMDMTVIDLTHAPSVKEGDWVEAEYSLRDASAISGLSQYELLTLLGQRFSRAS